MKLVKNLWILAIGAAFMASCTDLDTYPEDSVFTSEQKQEIVSLIPGRLAADINGMYSQLGAQYSVFGSASARADDFGFPTACLSADLNGADMVSTDDSYNWFSASNQYQDRTYTYANPYMRWAVFYNQIKSANDILAAIPDGTEDPTLLFYKGQALTIRAFDYFNLVQMFQFTYKGNEDKPSVPIVTFGMTDVNNPRQPVSAIYELVMSDLDQAIPLLEGYTRASKGFVDQQVAYGIRARVNLVMENWADAATDAAAARTGYTLLSKADVSVPSFNTAEASSWMWALMINPVNVPDQLATWPSKLCSFSGYGYTTAVGCYKMINTLLWSKISNTDVRKGWWVDENLLSPVVASLSWPGYEGQPIGPLNVTDIKMPFIPYTNVKFGAYKSEMGNPDNASDWCMMRAEEMLLIEAEGKAMSGDVSGAKTLLEDFIKTNRDPNYVCNASNAQTMQNEVWLQRRIELWGEGFAFNDAMRLKRNIVRFNNRIVTNFPEAFRFNMAADNGWLLLRIPQRETNSNTGIPESANNSDGSTPNPGDGAGLTDGVTD